MDQARPATLNGQLTPEELAAVAQLREAEVSTGINAVPASLTPEKPALTANLSDTFVSYFLFARKMEVARAALLLKNHMEWRVTYEIDHPDLIAIKRILATGCFAFLPPDVRGPKGEGIGFIFAQHMDMSLIQDIKIMMQMTWYLTEQLYQANLDNARHGVTYIEDFTNMTFGKIMSMASDSSKNKISFDAIQDHLPGRFTNFYMTNCPWWIRLAVKMMQPFMKPKLRNKFAVCTLEEVAHKLGGPQFLPAFLGGSRPDFHLQDVWTIFPAMGEVDLAKAAALDATAK